VLGLFMPNCPEFALVFHGTLAAAGVVTTVNSLCTVQDAAYQLRDAPRTVPGREQRREPACPGALPERRFPHPHRCAAARPGRMNWAR